MPLVPKNPPLKDPAYIRWLHSQPCIITGQRGTDTVGVDPMHIGTFGKGMKADDEALPVTHWIHAMAHAKGEMSVLREQLPDHVLRAALRAYARERYQEYLDEIGRAA